MKYTNKVYIQQIIKALQIIRESKFKKVSLHLQFKNSYRCALAQTVGPATLKQQSNTRSVGPATPRALSSIVHSLEG